MPFLMDPDENHMIAHPDSTKDRKRSDATGATFSPADFTIVLVLDFASITGGQAKVAIENRRQPVQTSNNNIASVNGPNRE